MEVVPKTTVVKMTHVQRLFCRMAGESNILGKSVYLKSFGLSITTGIALTTQNIIAIHASIIVIV